MIPGGGPQGGSTRAARFAGSVAALLAGVGLLLSACGGSSINETRDPESAGTESRQDSGATAIAPSPQEERATEVWWDEATGAVDSVAEVCGPLAGTAEIEEGIFLNLGHDFPAPDRFQFVIWGSVLAELASNVEEGATVCASGPVTTYEGVPQIELDSASDVVVMREAAPPEEPGVGSDGLVYFEWSEYPYVPLAPLSGEVFWTEALDRVGSHDLVCGPLAGFDPQQDGVLLSIGNPYPNSARFMIAVQGRTQNVVETHGEYVPTVCGEGQIREVEGVAAIAVSAERAWFKAADGALYPLFVR